MEIDGENIICPYCQNKCGDSDDFEGYEVFDEESIEFKCNECEKKFLGRRCVTIDFRTEGDCKLNNEEHEKGTYHCKKCDVYNCYIEKKETSK